MIRDTSNKSKKHHIKLFILFIMVCIGLKIYFVVHNNSDRIYMSRDYIRVRYNHYIFYQKLSPNGDLIEISSQDDLITGAMLSEFTGDSNWNGELPSVIYDTRQFKSILILPYGTKVLDFSPNEHYVVIQNTFNNHLYIENLASHLKYNVPTNSHVIANAIFVGNNTVFCSAKNYQITYDFLVDSIIYKSAILSSYSTLSHDRRLLIMTTLKGINIFNNLTHKYISSIHFNNHYISGHANENIIVTSHNKYIICTMPDDTKSIIFPINNLNHYILIPISNVYSYNKVSCIMGSDKNGNIEVYNIHTKNIQYFHIHNLANSFTLSGNSSVIALFISSNGHSPYNGYIYLGKAKDILRLLSE